MNNDNMNQPMPLEDSKVYTALAIDKHALKYVFQGGDDPYIHSLIDRLTDEEMQRVAENIRDGIRECEIFYEAVEESLEYVLSEPSNTMPRRLPIVRRDGKWYYKDDRLQQYRNVFNPHEFKPFAEVIEEDD